MDLTDFEIYIKSQILEQTGDSTCISRSQVSDATRSGDEECLELYVISAWETLPAKLEQGVLVDSGAGVTIADGGKHFAEYDLEPGMTRTFIGPGKETISNRGQRRPKLRLGHEKGPVGSIKFQDAPVRRPILSVGDSTRVGNLLVMDEEVPAILFKGCPEIDQIRQLVRRAKMKIEMRKQNNVFQIDAWVMPKNAR